MVNNNDLINLVNNKKPVELVQELKDYEIKKSPLSVAARGKVINKSGSGYVSEDKDNYGPGKDSSFNCSFDQDGLNCALGAEVWASEEGGTKRWIYKGSVGGKADSSSSRIEASKSLTYMSSKNSSEECSFFGASIGGSLDASGTPNLSAGVNLYSFKDEDKQISIRPNLDTGMISDNGCHGVKLGGFGVSVGKYAGISTPLGEAKFNTDNCIIQ